MAQGAMAGSQAAGMSADMVAARLDRLPVSSWHVRVRLILGIATFFDAVDLLAISFALPAIVGPWHLSPPQIGAVISAAFVGQIIGAFAAGWAAEVFGRLRTVTIAVAIFGLMSFACAFAWNAQSLMAFRFIQGIGLGGEVPIATAYIIELARGEGRGRFYILYELIFAFGLVAAALLGYVMVPRLGWQSMFYLGAVPAVLAVFLTRLLPELPRWLASQGRLAEADAIVARIERQIEASGKVLPPPIPVSPAPEPASRRRWFEMLAPAYRTRTLGVWAMWFCCFSTTYGSHLDPDALPDQFPPAAIASPGLWACRAGLRHPRVDPLRLHDRQGRPSSLVCGGSAGRRCRAVDPGRGRRQHCGDASDLHLDWNLLHVERVDRP